jgi:hypothetical protein
MREIMLNDTVALYIYGSNKEPVILSVVQVHINLMIINCNIFNFSFILWVCIYLNQKLNSTCLVLQKEITTDSNSTDLSHILDSFIGIKKGLGSMKKVWI